MAARRNVPVSLAAGAIVLIGAGGFGASPPAAVPPARPAKSADLQACAKGGAYRNAPLVAPSDASVADFARMLNGTWLRRLTIGSQPIQTNSFWYFDMSSPETGRGQALMIDRINQGWDHLESVTGSGHAIPARPATKASFDRQAEDGRSPAAEPLPPATTGAYWTVSIRPAPADAASRGHSGVILALAGDYRGTGDDYPPNGFSFTESGGFYRDRAGYATLHPWRAPPQASGSADSSSSVDAVILKLGGAHGAGNAARRPTLTFIICQDEIVDRYYKLSNAAPTVGGVSLRAAWDAAIASGTFRAAPAR